MLLRKIRQKGSGIFTFANEVYGSKEERESWGGGGGGTKREREREGPPRKA